MGCSLWDTAVVLHIPLMAFILLQLCSLLPNYVFPQIMIAPSHFVATMHVCFIYLSINYLIMLLFVLNLGFQISGRSLTSPAATSRSAS